MARALLPCPPKFSLTRYVGLALAPRAWRECWVRGAGARIDAVARMGPRAGPRIWEIRELYIGPRIADDSPRLLEDIAARAAAAGALRVMMRLPDPSPVYEHARQAGFVPHLIEHLYRRPAGRGAGEEPSPTGAKRIGLRAREPSDSHALFRLYCSTTPVDVRAQAGMTATEWTDGLERAAHPVREWVLERDSQIQAWLRTGPSRSGQWISLCAVGELADEIPSILDCAIGPNAGAVSLVPAYDLAVSQAMEMRGFVRERTYHVLARPLAVRVKQPAGAVAAIG